MQLVYRLGLTKRRDETDWCCDNPVHVGCKLGQNYGASSHIYRTLQRFDLPDFSNHDRTLNQTLHGKMYMQNLTVWSNS